ncbi:MAG: hypothetical protein AB8B64_13920 [Granulosicoccus sp.]
MNAISGIFLVLSLCLTATVARADVGELFVSNPPRAFGYAVGDILEQTIGLKEGETTHTVQELPDTQREGRWITRHSIELQPNGQKLTIRYQIVNSPPDVRFVSLPALTLNTDQGRSIDIPEWSFSIAPLTPTLPSSENPLPVMQADWKPEAPSSTKLWRNIKTLSATLLLSFLLWFAWWVVRGMREAGTLPFAHAYRKIRRHTPNTTDGDASTWLALHRAFDQMGGRSINGGSIDTLLQTAKWLEPFESDIRAFYRLSSERFFANENTETSFDLQGLSKRLYKAEKRHTNTLPKRSLTTQEMS